MEHDQAVDTETAPSQSGEITQPDSEDKTEATTAEPSVSEIEISQQQIARMNEEIQTYKDRWMRLAAEFDNYKKRTGREFGTLVKNANGSLIGQLLPAIDNMERALQAAQTTDATRTFVEGFEMIRQQLMDTLRREGLQDIDAAGQPFDPNRHEAIMTVEDAERPAQTIVDVIEKGYVFNERVIRPAKVIVTRRPESE
ncbi:MAG: nucleotide exchange factor GrpE [candidate division Zixibacteria bacterium]|nr:nucleotide exchange factor GrpE [candidate division Zixibacteria bacterium]